MLTRPVELACRRRQSQTSYASLFLHHIITCILVSCTPASLQSHCRHKWLSSTIPGKICRSTMAWSQYLRGHGCEVLPRLWFALSGISNPQPISLDSPKDFSIALPCLSIADHGSPTLCVHLASHTALFKRLDLRGYYLGSTTTIDRAKASILVSN